MGEALARDALPSDDLVVVAHVDNRPEAEMIQGLLKGSGIPSLLQATGVNGPALGFGLLPHSPQRVLVRASQADAARHLLAERTWEAEGEIAGAAYLDDANGRGPRSYGPIGGYVRSWLVSLSVMGAAFGIFMLLRVV